MKQPWLILAALVASAAAAAVVDETALHQVESARYSWWPCGRPGCYSSISGMETIEHKPTHRPFLLDSQLQPILEEKLTGGTRLSILQDLKLQAPVENIRAKRNTRKASLARRRGKQREGVRRVCRGCYSGLTIVAPPAQDGKNMSLMWSHSESDEDSSAGY